MRLNPEELQSQLGLPNMSRAAVMVAGALIELSVVVEAEEEQRAARSF
jgi:hypothetical protein